MLSSDSLFPFLPAVHAPRLCAITHSTNFRPVSAGRWSSILPPAATARWNSISLRLTTAALRTLPDREIPQRIAFVSDKVFEPSPFRRFFGARLGFASACVLAAALVVSAWHFSDAYRPAEVQTVVHTASVSPQQINDAVAKAVAQVRTEDAQMIQDCHSDIRAEARPGISQPDGRHRGELYGAPEETQHAVTGCWRPTTLQVPEQANEILLVIITVATLCFAATESRVSRATILAVEKASTINSAVHSADPYDLMGMARGHLPAKVMERCSRLSCDLINVRPHQHSLSNPRSRRKK